MDESNDAAVSAVLLGYSMLSKTQRSAFMDRLNHFMFVSSQQQRRLVGEWLTYCMESEDSSARRVAESPTAYILGNKKARKK
jgi:predicted amidohydrolase YtcJ